MENVNKAPEPPKTTETMTDLELGLALPQQFQMLMQIQQNIQAITREFEARKQRVDKAIKELNNEKP